jgi:hypothetical protein
VIEIREEQPGDVAAIRELNKLAFGWTTIRGGASVGPVLASMASEDLALLEARMRARLSADATGRITYSAEANAVRGRIPIVRVRGY